MMQTFEFGKPERSDVSSLPIVVSGDEGHLVEQELEIGIRLVERHFPIRVVVLPGVMQSLPTNLIEIGILPTGFYIAWGTG